MCFAAPCRRDAPTARFRGGPGPRGGRYSDAWHVDHLTDPLAVVPESVMTPYGFLLDARLDLENIGDLLAVSAMVGVPDTDAMIAGARADVVAQLDPFADTDALLAQYPNAAVSNFDGQAAATEIDALVAYLQVLGTMVDFSTFEPDPNR